MCKGKKLVSLNLPSRSSNSSERNVQFAYHLPGDLSVYLQSKHIFLDKMAYRKDELFSNAVKSYLNSGSFLVPTIGYAKMMNDAIDLARMTVENFVKFVASKRIMRL